MKTDATKAAWVALADGHPHGDTEPDLNPLRPDLPLFWRVLPGLLVAAGLPCLAAWAGQLYPSELGVLAHPGAVGAAALAGLVLGATWLWRQLLHPLRQLRTQAHQLAGGRHCPPPCPRRQDELGQLGMALHQAGWNHQALRRDIGAQCGGLELVGNQLIDAHQLMLRGLQHQDQLLQDLDPPSAEGAALPAVQALLQSCDLHQASRNTLVQVHALVDELQDMAHIGRGQGEVTIGTARLALAARRAQGVLAQSEQACAALQRISQLLGKLRDAGRADRQASLEKVREQQLMQGRLLASSLRALEAMVHHARQVHALSREPSPEARRPANAAVHPFAD